MVSAVAPGSRIARCLLLVLIGLGLGVISYPAFTDDADAAFAAGNFQKAFEIWLPRAYEGDTEAQFRVALMLDSGKGVVQNVREAAYWFTHAAELGHTGAQYRIGVIHLSGLGAPKDLARALGW
ncbi:MAG: tetratricopeptide repeat protein, partial [Pseudomonadota bacterium]